jgi:hypothetical protein
MPIGFETGDRGGDLDELGDRFVRFLAAPLVPVIYTRWETSADERVCPECGPLNGLSWPEHAGPTPPLHNHCRCQRTFAYVEWRSTDAR